MLRRRQLKKLQEKLTRRNFSNCSEDVQAARKLAAAAEEAVANSKKERRQKRADEAEKSGPAETAVESAKRMLDKKRVSSEINYDVLEKFFAELENFDTTKKTQFE
ncbi:hypothetical protein ACP275_01G064800 [Erythranthe tilingii]